MSQPKIIEKAIHDLEIESIHKLKFKKEITKKAKLDIGHRCNADCYFCYYKNSLDSPVKPLADIKKDIDFLIDAGFTSIELSGGEPTIHPDFIEILNYITDRNIKVSFLTNAIVIDEKMMQDIYLAGCRDILISIQGFGTIHDSILKHNGAYNNIMVVLTWMRDLEMTARVNTVVQANTSGLPLIWNDIKHRITHWNLLPLNHWGDAKKLKRLEYHETGMALNYLLRNRKPSDPIINIRYFPFCFIDEVYHDNLFNNYQQYFDEIDWHPFFMSSADLTKRNQEAVMQKDIKFYQRDLINRRTKFFKKELNCLKCPLFNICDGFKR